MIYGLRVYRVVQGRMAALLIRSAYCALGWRDDFLGTVGWRRNQRRPEQVQRGGLRRPDSQFCRESRVTGILVLFSTLTASDWLKPFCFAPAFQANDEWQRFLRHEGLIMPQRAKFC